MKKVISIIGVFVCVMVLVANVMISSEQNSSNFDLKFVQLNAMADGESGQNLSWSSDIDCAGLLTGSYRVCQEQGGGNSCSPGGATTCTCGVNC